MKIDITPDTGQQMKKLLRQPQNTNVRVRVVGASHWSQTHHPTIDPNALVPSTQSSKVQAVAKNFSHNLRTVAKKIDKAKMGGAVGGQLFDEAWSKDAARICQLLPFRMNQSATAAWVATATTVYPYCCHGRFYNSWSALKSSSSTDDCNVSALRFPLSNRKNPLPS